MSEVDTPGHNWSEYVIEQNFSHQRHGCGALLQRVDLSVVSRLSPFWENPPHLSLSPLATLAPRALFVRSLRHLALLPLTTTGAKRVRESPFN